MVTQPRGLASQPSAAQRDGFVNRGARLRVHTLMAMYGLRVLALGSGLFGFGVACSGSGQGSGDPGSLTHGAGQSGVAGMTGLGGAAGFGGSMSSVAGASASTGAAGSIAGGGMSANGSGGAGAASNMSGAAGASGAAGGSATGCPAAPPFDSSDAALVAKCAQVVYASVGDNLRRALSFDGTTWTNDVENTDAAKLGAARMGEYQLSGLVIQNGIILASGDGGVFRSVDGATWTHIEDTEAGLPSGIAVHQTRLGFGRGGGFGLGTFGITGNGGTWTSTDGATWTSWKDARGKIKGTNIDASFSGHGKGAAFGNGKLIFASDDNVTRVFDGSTWSIGKIDGLTQDVSDIAFGNGLFMGVTDSGERAVSADGVTWNAASDGSFRFGRLFVDASAGRIYASATQYSRQLYASTNGLAWTTTNTDTGFFGIVLHAGLWVGAQHTGISTSSDGKAFTQRTKDSEFGLFSAAVGYVLK